MLVLHYTGMTDFDAALSKLTDPDAGVSAHYVIDEVGEIYQLVPEDRRAWHAGVSSWRGNTDINGCSIGIELVNPGHEFGYRTFPEQQMAALCALSKDILVRCPIPPQRVLGHSDVAPSRRRDPGELFDWEEAASSGIGIWPEAFSTLPQTGGDSLAPGSSGGEIRSIQERLAQFGYGIEPTGEFDASTRDIVLAFQRHFRPSRVDGIVDPESQYRLDVLIENYG